MQNKIYINSIKQISVQQPLSDDWFNDPLFYNEPYVRAIDPDYKQFFTPNEARRLGKILKRALLVSRHAMTESGVASPDAIITGTGLGCIENTEIFLNKLVREGEEMLNPTHFMQSTHNTIGSLIAIDAKCNAYNTTYAHKGISFECALQDAFIQLEINKIKNALVGAHDEMTPDYFTLLKKAGYLGKQNQTFAGETAVAMMLSTEKTEKTLCEVGAVVKIYLMEDMGCETMRYETKDKIRSQISESQISNPKISNLKISHLKISESQISNPDYIMIGINGDPENDRIYFDNCAKLFPNVPLLHYKHIFGEGYTAPSLGVYAAAGCLQKGEIPEHLKCNIQISNLKSQNLKSQNLKSKILCYNHFEGKNHTFVLLQSV
jgi:hypothetical protein